MKAWKRCKKGHREQVDGLIDPINLLNKRREGKRHACFIRSCLDVEYDVESRGA